MQDDVLGDKQAIIRFRALEGLNAVVPDWREKDWAEGVGGALVPLGDSRAITMSERSLRVFWAI